MVEIKNKKTGLVSEMSTEEAIEKIDLIFPQNNKTGVKGKLNFLIGLSEGEIYQDMKTLVRLKGLDKYEWEWSK